MAADWKEAYDKAIEEALELVKDNKEKRRKMLELGERLYLSGVNAQKATMRISLGLKVEGDL
jgi:hypothetical protein